MVAVDADQLGAAQRAGEPEQEQRAVARADQVVGAAAEQLFNSTDVSAAAGRLR